MLRRLKVEERKLIRRYLIWCYKTTKEQIDRIDRKFTQLKADYYILSEISKKNTQRSRVSEKHYSQFVEEFKAYIRQKEKDALQSKFSKESRHIFQPRYQYLKNRLSAIEKAISFFLGEKETLRVQSLYEQEMTRRILEAREPTREVTREIKFSK